MLLRYQNRALHAYASVTQPNSPTNESVMLLRRIVKPPESDATIESNLYAFFTVNIQVTRNRDLPYDNLRPSVFASQVDPTVTAT